MNRARNETRQWTFDVRRWAERARSMASERKNRSFEDLELAQASSRATEANVQRAKAEAKRQGVFEYDVDERGVPIPSSARRFSLLASHRAIGRTSTSLGLYLDAATQLGALAVILALAAAYSLVTNLKDVAFSSTYAVRGSAGGVESTCMRPYTTDGAVLRSSQGSRCAIPTLESFFNCPMTCEYDGVGYNFTNACGTHYPCTLESVLTPTQYAVCCTPKLSNTATQTPREFQGVQTVVTILFFLFEIWYTRNQQQTAKSIMSTTVTAADYSVYVEGFGKGNMWSRKDVADFFAHYGDVVSVCHLTNTARLVKLESQIFRAVNIRNEIQARIFEDMTEGESKSSVRKLRELMFRYLMLDGYKADENSLIKLDDQIADFKRKVAKHDETGVTNVQLGMAVVTFNYEDHATNCCEDHVNDYFEQFKQVVTRKRAPDFNGNKIRVKRAPESSDINWQNLRSRRSNAEIVFSFAGTYITLGVALVAGGIVQYFFEGLRNEELVAIEKEIALSSSASLSSQFNLQLITAASSLVIVAINAALDSLTVFLTSREMYATKTAANNALLVKLTVVQLLNYVVVPVLTNRCSNAADGQCNWYTPGGLIEQAFYLQLFNILALPTRILNVTNRFIVIVLAPLARTYDILYQMLEPEEFDLARQYSELLKIIGLAAIYGPALPASYSIAAIGVLMCYCCNKYRGLRLSQVPPKLYHNALGVRMAIRIISLLQILFGCLVFYRFDTAITVTLWVNLAIWFVALLPIRRFMGFFLPPELAAKSTGGVSFVNNAGLRDSSGQLRSLTMRRSSSVKMPDLNQENVENAPESRSELVRKAFMARMYKCELHELENGRLTLYHPPVPTHASPKQLEALLKLYEPFEELVPANPVYLPDQKESTGGIYTQPPSKTSVFARKKLDIIDSFNKRR